MSRYNNAQDVLEFKDLLRAKYKDLKEAFKFYSCTSPAGEIWSISQNVFTDFLLKSGIVDYKIYGLQQGDIIFFCVNSIYALDISDNPIGRLRTNPQR